MVVEDGRGSAAKVDGRMDGWLVDTCDMCSNVNL